MTNYIPNKRFLIICGTSKAATTAVFNYLAGHPQINASHVKETRYFLDSYYPLPSKYRLEKHGIQRYLDFFDQNTNKEVNLEATPDYLYSPSTPDFIRSTLKNVELLFLLRNPISRFQSWHEFSRARGIIRTDMGIAEFLRVQVKDDFYPTDAKHPAFMALLHGNYSEYLKRYLEKYEVNKLHIMFHENLALNPRKFMENVCKSVSIGETYFQGYEFRKMNKSVRVKSPKAHRVFANIKEKTRILLQNYPRARTIFRKIRPWIENRYAGLNVISSQREPIDIETIETLIKYYGKEKYKLADMFNLEVPWNL